jgi:diacylglycerol kinase (ATP)
MPSRNDVTKHVGIIANPAAGSGSAIHAAGALSALLRQQGIRTTMIVPASAAATAACAAELADSHDVVVACGGDGTANIVANACVGPDTPFALLPAGTGDDNARSLGVARDAVRLAESLQTWMQGSAPIKRIDLALASWGSGCERHFLGVLSTGFDSAVNERANASARFSGTARYVTALLAELRTMAPVTYRITVDDAEVVTDALIASVGNGGSYGGGMRVCPEADMTDGLLDLTILRHIPRSTFIRVFPRVYRGTHTSHPAVTTMRGSRITISAASAIAYADGERFGPVPVSIEVRPKALQVIGSSTA